IGNHSQPSSDSKDVGTRMLEHMASFDLSDLSEDDQPEVDFTDKTHHKKLSQSDSSTSDNDLQVQSTQRHITPSDRVDGSVDKHEGISTPFTPTEYFNKCYPESIKQRQDSANTTTQGQLDDGFEQPDLDSWMPKIDHKFDDLKTAKEDIASWAAQFGFR
ncbi:hypothetical protein BGZ83_004645, partial [Gryganskiella cystojenkinii]